MMGRARPAAGLLAAVLLAGCAGAPAAKRGEPEPSAGSSPTASPTPGGPTSTSR